MSPARPFLIASFVLAALLPACGDDDSSGSTAAPATTTAVGDMGGMGDMGGTGSDEGEHVHDESHDHGDAVQWDGGELPEIAITVEPDGAGGWIVTFTVTNFEFNPDPASTDHVPGMGHAHLLVDGQVYAMTYSPEVHVAGLEPGMHEFRVTLASNDHSDYAVGGEIVGNSVMVDVAGEADAADASADFVYSAGVVTGPDRLEVAPGGVVELIVASDVDEEIHVHTYDIVRDVAAGETVTIRFTADIPGIFEVEFEGSHLLITELRVG